MSKKFISDTELANPGFANGISTFLEEHQRTEGESASLPDSVKQDIIKKAAKSYGEFLDALGVDWKNDPNSADTPTRVAKAYVNDLWKGRYTALDPITTFPADGYDGIIQESNIPITSMCSHHHQQILGTVSIAYVPGEKGQVVGLSKLNRLPTLALAVGE